jgi:hypothetical protein
MDLHTQYHATIKAGLYYNPCNETLMETPSYVHSKGTVEHQSSVATNDESSSGSNHGDMVTADAVSWLVARKFTRHGMPQSQTEVAPLNSILGRRLLAQKLEKVSNPWR